MRILVLTLLGAITLGSVAAATFEALPTFQAEEVQSAEEQLSLIHISEPTRLGMLSRMPSYA